MRYDEILSSSIRAAQNLRARGHEKNEIFAFLANNSDNLSSIVFGSLYLGCTIFGIDVASSKSDIKYKLNSARPSLVFCDSNVHGLVKECLSELQNDAVIFTFGGHMDGSEPVERLLVETGDERNFV